MTKATLAGESAVTAVSPEEPTAVMAPVRICCVSDTHGDERSLGSLPPCDVLVHAGDLTLYGREVRNPHLILIILT